MLFRIFVLLRTCMGLSRKNAQSAEKLFKCLASASRLKILFVLLESEKSVGDITVDCDMSQPLVSQHLRHLRDNNLVYTKRHGKQVYYSIADEHIKHVVADCIQHVQHET
ncbi:ArsR/SmtB family transcription factor [Tropheryma whipplei]|uniref:ArsR/SmtB family transcription factor n=1 Tax=Tropheryma whipplei TaxID=2039 RepID=UPI001E2BD0F0|nr:metalloregulator ArsR/SmtB family transcription factor [Tropheryma whipplei]MCO8190378.1 metalloregulator ArsR/SmtB family transcription factor [Tropheryma whipplei]